jgi:2'-5' RNA ligase
LRETALVVEVPEAQEVYDAWVGTWDPPPGLPAHVTLLFPFVPAEELGGEVLGELAMLFGAQPAFAFRLARVERFPEAAWLAPEPPEPFVELTEALVQRFSAFPPYGGIHDRIVPHLTIVNRADTDLLARAEAELARLEPIEARAEEVTLLERREDGVWRRRETFRLGT